jgi:hypothetical protein
MTRCAPTLSGDSLADVNYFLLKVLIVASHTRYQGILPCTSIAPVCVLRSVSALILSIARPMLFFDGRVPMYARPVVPE